ncbi:ATP-binding protein [Pontibacter harenae]|uniref:ATP-binding protein n=1 Tax=Pontibacter harenae TaxID=2894083 RepID=UPI001E62987B|nr:ATP-binding protein [Pontibacter harenae]MCC9166847.1 PAS domain-containing protein [Pontibacter harenae]
MNHRETAEQQDLLQKLIETQQKLEERNEQLELLNQVGAILTSELELEKVVQNVTDIATKASKAQFGALFYKKQNEKGEDYTLYALSGADRSHFAHLPVLRETPMLSITFHGEGVVRSDDITKDARYGNNSPHRGMPKGHLPVKSYLAVPVISKSGTVLGGLFFGHRESGIFTQKEEDLVVGIAAQAAVAIDNAQLYEAKLQAEQRVSLVVESIPHMAWTSLSDGIPNYYNKRWYEYTGQTKEQVLSEGWASVLHPQDLEHSISVWEEAKKHEEVYEVEHRFRRVSDGAYRWHITRGVPVKDDNNRVVLWVGTCTDIDDYKRAQKSLLAKNEELVKINEDLDNFVYIASHDLKSPVLNIMQLVKELHQSATYTSKDSEVLLDYLDKSLQRLNSTIKDLAEVAKVQRDVGTSEDVFSVDEIVEDLLGSLVDITKQTGATITTDLQPGTSVALTKVNLMSVLYNLISNSIKYRSPDRPLEVNITGREEKEYYKLVLADNGLGMDIEGQREKLFQMFRRFHDHVPGSGVGLYIVNRIIKNQGGYIEVTSKVNEGSTFTLYLRKRDKEN